MRRKDAQFGLLYLLYSFLSISLSMKLINIPIFIQWMVIIYLQLDGVAWAESER